MYNMNNAQRYNWNTREVSVKIVHNILKFLVMQFSFTEGGSETPTFFTKIARE